MQRPQSVDHRENMSSKTPRKTSKPSSARTPSSRPATANGSQTSLAIAQGHASKSAASDIEAGSRKRGSAKPGVRASTGARHIANVCVYCGSGHGTNPAYTQAADALGAALAQAGIGLVYGGGGLGLMGEVARATRDAGGHVIGIIPEFLTQKEHMLRDVDQLMITKDMHERKRLMFENSDAFVALPGGIGTLEELVEQLTWSQLGQHTKPIVVANIDGFWDPLLNLLEHMRAQSFIRPGLMATYEVATSPDDILPLIHAEMDRRKGTPVDSGLVDRL